MKRSTIVALSTCAFALLAACGDDTGGAGGGGGGGDGGSSEGGSGGGTTSAQGGGGVGGEGGTGGSGGGAADSCAGICARYLELEAALECGYSNPSCVNECRAAFAADPDCEAPGVALNECLIDLDVSDWQCSGGSFAWGAGVCVDETNAVVLCSMGG